MPCPKQRKRRRAATIAKPCRSQGFVYQIGFRGLSEGRPLVAPRKTTKPFGAASVKVAGRLGNIPAYGGAHRLALIIELPCWHISGRLNPLFSAPTPGCPVACPPPRRFCHHGFHRA